MVLTAAAMVVALGLTAAAGATGWRRLRARRSAQVWRELAPRLELSLASDDPGRGIHLRGRHKGRPLEVWVHPDGEAEVRTGIAARLPSGLRLSSERAPGPPERQDIQVGVPKVDDSVVVGAEHPAAVIRLLREPSVAAPVERLFATHPLARVAGNEAVLRLSPGVAANELRAALGMLTAAADALEEAARDEGLRAEQAKALVRDAPAPELPARRFAPLDRSLKTLQARYRQRRRTYLLAGPGAAGAGIAAGALALRLTEHGAHVPGLTLLALALMGGGVGVTALFVGAALSCPACEAELRDGDGIYDPFAESCRGCGLRLR